MRVKNELKIPWDDNFFDEDYTEYDGVQCEENKAIIFLDGGMILIDADDDITIQDYPSDLPFDSFEELQKKFPDWKMTRPIDKITIIIKEG